MLAPVICGANNQSSTWDSYGHKPDQGEQFCPSIGFYIDRDCFNSCHGNALGRPGETTQHQSKNASHLASVRSFAFSVPHTTYMYAMLNKRKKIPGMRVCTSNEEVISGEKMWKRNFWLLDAVHYSFHFRPWFDSWGEVGRRSAGYSNCSFRRWKGLYNCGNALVLNCRV